jgi:hypothetical protein
LNSYATGGKGGGAIEIVSSVSITVGPVGVVQAGGGGAGPGFAGGGGAGGAILLEAPRVTVQGTLAANGGGGGGDGDPAEDGRPNATAASGGLNGTTVVGGSGSAGATIAGGNGLATPTNGLSGGGGGAGRIRINTQSGSATITGTLSPVQSTTCFSQGTLH